MSAKIQLFVASFAFVLNACAQMQGAAGSSSLCNSAVCKVEVAVADCAGGDIRATPETLEVSRNQRNVQVHWDLDRDAVNAGYTFTDRGIAIRENDGELSDPQRVENGRKFIWKNKNSNTKTYKYDIAVQRGTVACKPKDPFIVNGK
jgi:hypothetical protein